jgi:hypothetical protein
MSNAGYHEPTNELTDETRDMHRAITSLMEELEAVDWYNQRVERLPLYRQTNCTQIGCPAIPGKDSIQGAGV